MDFTVSKLDIFDQNWSKFWPKKDKILSRGLESQRRPLFHRFSSLDYSFFIKIWNLEFTGSKSDNLVQNWSKFGSKGQNIIRKPIEPNKPHFVHHWVHIFHIILTFGLFMFKFVQLLQYQKIFLESSFGCKNVLNFTCLTLWNATTVITLILIRLQLYQIFVTRYHLFLNF